MNKLKGIRTVLGVVHIVLSIVTIVYCIATWRREDTADVIDAEIVEYKSWAAHKPPNIISIS